MKKFILLVIFILSFSIIYSEEIISNQNNIKHYGGFSIGFDQAQGGYLLGLALGFEFTDYILAAGNGIFYELLIDNFGFKLSLWPYIWIPMYDYLLSQNVSFDNFTNYINKCFVRSDLSILYYLFDQNNFINTYIGLITGIYLDKYINRFFQINAGIGVIFKIGSYSRFDISYYYGIRKYIVEYYEERTLFTINLGLSHQIF